MHTVISLYNCIIKTDSMNELSLFHFYVYKKGNPTLTKSHVHSPNPAHHKTPFLRLHWLFLHHYPKSRVSQLSMISTKTPIIPAYIVCKRNNYIVELIMAENSHNVIYPSEGF